MKPYFTTFFLFFLFVLPFSAHAQDSIRFDESGLESVIQRAKVEKNQYFTWIMPIGVHIVKILRQQPTKTKK
jgi:hypothetical protein